MTIRIEVSASKDTNTTQKGRLLEQLGREVLESMQYEVIEEVRLTGMEVDLIAKNKVNGRKIYVECKAFRNPIRADTISKLLGNVELNGVDSGWLFSTAPFGKDAKGLLEKWEEGSSEKRRKLQLYTPERLAELLIDSKNICSPEFLIKPEGYSFSDEIYLLITDHGRFWAVQTTGHPRSVILFDAITGVTISDARTIRSVSETDNSLKKANWLRTGRPSCLKTYYLQPATSLLETDNREEHFFRITGPLWIDFEKKLVVERKELTNFLKKLDRQRCQLLIGNAASGKTTLLRNIAYRLINDVKNDVFWLNAEKICIYPIRDIFNEIVGMDKEGVCIIIDDIHKCPTHCTDLISLIKANTTNLKLVLSTRPSYKYIYHRHDKNIIVNMEDSKQTCTFVKAEDIIINIVTNYIKKRGITISKPTLNRLRELCGNDLWILMYLIKSMEIDDSGHVTNVNINYVYENIKDDFINSNDIISPHFSDIVIAVASFSQYEIPVFEYFLTDRLKFDTNSLSNLVQIGAILKDMRSYSLPHSSLARLYLGTAQVYPLLSVHLRQICDGKDDYSNNILKLYLESKPENYDTFSRQLRNEPRVFEKILNDGVTSRKVAEIINSENNIMNIASWISDISWRSNKLWIELIKALDIEALRAKSEREQDVRKIGFLLGSIPWKTIFSTEDNFEKLEHRIFDSLYIKHEDIKKTDFCIWRLPWNNSLDNIKKNIDKLKVKEIKEWSKNLDFSDIKICVRSIYSDKTTLCAKSLVCEPIQFARDIIKMFDIDNMTKKINLEKDIYRISYLIRVISWCDNEVSSMLIKKLSLNSLLNKIAKEVSVEKKIVCAWSIYKANRNIGERIINSFDQSLKDTLTETGWIQLTKSF